MFGGYFLTSPCSYLRVFNLSVAKLPRCYQKPREYDGEGEFNQVKSH